MNLRSCFSSALSLFVFTFCLCLLSVGQVRAQQPAWNSTGSLGTGRALHTSTLLVNGKALVVGGCSTPCVNQTSAELYDSATGQWSATGSMAIPRINHTAVRLANGKVLAIGGDRGSPARNRTNSVELYDPESGTWSPTGNLMAAREMATATLLPNGKVLVTGGSGTGNNLDALASAELYDPASGSWSPAGTMSVARSAHTATLLPNGKVLIASGAAGTFTAPVLHASAELYDPATNNWTPTGSLATARPFLKSVLLPNGKVLAVGGSNFVSAVHNTAELYDPATGQWSATGSMAVPRQAHTLTLLSNGRVLAVANTAGQGSAELYDPATGNWAATASLSSNVRLNHAATLLLNGKVLVTGGNGPLASAELYDSAEPVAATVSAASYSLQLAPKEIVAAFGQNFSTATESARTAPLPTALAGAGVKVRDSFGVERQAPLFFVSPNQINYQIPEGTTSGQVIVTISASDGRAHFGMLDLAPAAPAIFTANQSGSGPAAALDAFTFAAAPFNATRSNGEANIIAVFGSGLGADVTDADGNVSASVEARIDGQAVTVLYAGRAPGFVGLNQFNLQLPVGVSAGAHTLVISRNGVVSNTVTIETR